MLGVLDDEGFFKDVDHAWFTTLGRLPSEIENRQFFESVHPDDLVRTALAFDDARNGQPLLRFENRYRHKNGGYRWLSGNAVQENGFFVCNARDITQEKENAATLKTRDDEARLREQFVGVLGHDLRNSIAAIDAACHLLALEPQSDKTREMIGWGKEAVARMTRLINDFTDFARSRLGEGLAIDITDKVALGDVAEQVVEEIRRAHSKREVRHNFNFGRPRDCDPDRISQLLSNLVGNALAHGAPDNPIHVSGGVVDDMVSLKVENGGDPIPKDALATLFELFSRADSQGANKGLGLGLYIDKQIAIGHGGTMTVRSDVESTVFTLEMPISRQEKGPIELTHWA